MPQVDFGHDDGRFRSGVTSLAEYGVLKVHGADAASFLQAQLTNDVASLGAGEVRLAGYCSVKGRLTASFWVWRDPAQQVFWLACSRDIAAAVAKRLSMFVLRAKAKVENASDTMALVGLVSVDEEPLPAAAMTPAAPAASASAEDPGSAGFIGLPPVIVGASLASALRPEDSPAVRDLRIERAMRLVPAGALSQTLQQLAAAGARMLSATVWRRLEVLSGVARINASNQELFVPQMVNFELVGGVSFKKGCYPGQEVVARSQYLGKLKRRMFLGLGHGPVPLPGADVEAGAQAAAEPVGQVVLAAPLDDQGRFVVLFESRTAAVPETGAGQDTGLRTGASALLRLPLPYALPSSGKADGA